MVTFGYFLASEEHGPDELVRQARLAQRAEPVADDLFQISGQKLFQDAQAIPTFSIETVHAFAPAAPRRGGAERSRFPIILRTP